MRESSRTLPSPGIVRRYLWVTGSGTTEPSPIAGNTPGERLIDHGGQIGRAADEAAVTGVSTTTSSRASSKQMLLAGGERAGEERDRGDRPHR